MSDVPVDKDKKRQMKIAANAAAFRQELPKCPYCGGGLAVVSRSQQFGSIEVTIKCTACKESIRQKIKT